MERRSSQVTQGVERAPHRSLFYALGYTEEELNRPLIGVVSAHSEIVPGHFHLDKIAEAVKAGIRMAGGTPIEVPAIGVCDGIAMGHIGMKYSLASRELIADSTETMALAHCFDGLVLVPNCDKIVPGMVMAAALVPDGISDYESLDNQPVRLVAMIAARLDQHAEYLQLLSCLSSELKADVFRAGLFRCTNASELFRELISQDR